MTTTPTAICIIVENLPVPLDRRVWREACALRDAGYHVSVICPKGTGTSSAAYQNIEGVEIYRHSTWQGSGVIGYLLEYTAALICESYLVLKVYTRTKFRILQACNPPDNIFLIGLLLRPFGVRFIFDHHDLAPELLESKFGNAKGGLAILSKWLEYCSFRFSTVSIATNESFKDVAMARGRKHPDDVFIVRNCPDLANFSGTKPAIIPNGSTKPLSVIYVGFMGSQDGLPILIDAVEHIVKDKGRTNVTFTLVGAGSDLPALRKLVADKGLETCVTFTGQVPYEEVLTYLATADIGVAPDPKTPMNDKSTMIKILEYMACSIPVVLFDLKEGRRIAESAALYASPNDPIDFGGQIIKLLDSEELRRRLGARGRERVEESLNWNCEKKVLLEAYKKALA